MSIRLELLFVVFMVQADSALSKEVKLANLSEEITRRLRNTSLEVERSRRLEILEEAVNQWPQ
jgi:hypothetical protein